MSTCLRCKYEWLERVTTPKKCPRCLSYRYDQERTLLKQHTTPTVVVAARGGQLDDFAENAAQRLKYARKDEWEQRVLQLKEYCEENDRMDAYETVIARTLELKAGYKRED